MKYYIFLSVFVLSWFALTALAIRFADRVEQKSRKRRHKEIVQAAKLMYLVSEQAGPVTMDEFDRAVKTLEHRYHLGMREHYLDFYKSDEGQMSRFIADEILRQRKAAQGGNPNAAKENNLSIFYQKEGKSQ